MHAIINGASGEAIHLSDGYPVPIPRWRITPREDSSEIFYIADPERGTSLKDAGAGTEIDAISADAFSSGGPEHDSIRSWQLVALTAADNITSVDKTIKFARPAMGLLLEQWQDKTIVYKPKNPVASGVHR